MLHRTVAMENMVRMQLAYGPGSTKALQLCKRLSNFGFPNYSIEHIEKIKNFPEGYLDKFKSVDVSKVDKIISDCDRNNINIISVFSPLYPKRLRYISDPPVVLYVKGNLPDLDEIPAFCIVGPRKVSDFGKKAAFSLSRRLSKAGMVIVSGGARGCDTFVHKGALSVKGQTIAVLGCGIGNDYLLENKRLRIQIANSCCLISEYPPFTPPYKNNFPVRNRIMSGLCVGTAVIEASERSGALITARHANEQGRDVFVIPGNPTYECYKGSNALLRDGAIPLIDASDILNLYVNIFPERLDLEKAFDDGIDPCNMEIVQKNLETTLSNDAKIVYNNLNKLSSYIFNVDELTSCGLSSERILSALTELELNGCIKSMVGGLYKII